MTAHEKLKLSEYRPCAVDVRKFHIPGIFYVMNGKEWLHSQEIEYFVSNYVQTFKLGTIRFIDFPACSREAASNTLYCTVS